MKKFFITLLLAIISICSSMAMDFSETIEVNEIKEGVYSISWIMDSCGVNKKYNENEWTLEISLYLYDERRYNDFEATEDYDYETKAKRLQIMRVAHLQRGMWESATYSNDTAYFSVTTESLSAWERDNQWNAGVYDYKLFSNESYFVGISFIHDDDYWGCCDYENCVTCYSGFFPTNPNTQSIWNTSITSTSQWHKEIRNGAICIVNDNNDTAYNIYGMKMQ